MGYPEETGLKQDVVVEAWHYTGAKGKKAKDVVRFTILLSGYDDVVDDIDSIRNLMLLAPSVSCYGW